MTLNMDKVKRHCKLLTLHKFHRLNPIQLLSIELKHSHFLWLSLGSNQYRAGRVCALCVYFMTGAPEG